MTTQWITGTAAGVPYVVVPPESGPATAPVVVGWHLMDPPRTETAFAAAIPLAGLDAWRVYLGLPMTGKRYPAGGQDEVMRLGAEDAVLNLYGPISAQAVDEFPRVYRELAADLGFRVGPIGVFGGSLGAAIALEVLAESDLPIAVAAVASPLTQLRPLVTTLAEFYGIDYRWTDASNAIADRLDFVSRAGALASTGAAVLLVTGADDSPAILEPAAALVQALAASDPHRFRLVSVPGMAHELALDPGLEPAPQTPQAAVVDRYLADWLGDYLPR